MTENDIGEYLDALIRDKMERAGFALDMFEGLTANSGPGKGFDALKLEAAISSYRGLVEVVTLLRVYNEYFHDDFMRNAQKGFERALTYTESGLVDFTKLTYLAARLAAEKERKNKK